jgi:hypothetical protein
LTEQATVPRGDLAFDDETAQVDRRKDFGTR